MDTASNESPARVPAKAPAVVDRREGSVGAAIRAASPRIYASRGWAEAHHQMAPEARDAARSAGAFMLGAPVEFGGWEAPLPQMLASFEELGAADPTLAWHASNSQGLCILSSRLDNEARESIFAGPPGPFGFSGAIKGRATRADGGYLLSGRWPTVTGAIDAQWVTLAGLIEDGRSGQSFNPGATRFFFLPGDALSIDRTWDGAPVMKGTGSHAVSVERRFVPEEFVRSPTDPLVVDRPLYRLPYPFSGPVVGAAIVVGIVRAALAHVVDLVASKTSSLDRTPLVDRPHFPARIAEADSSVHTMSATLQSMAHRVWAEAEEGRPSRAQRAMMWSTAYWVLDNARRTIGDVISVGTSGVYGGLNPAATGLRDLHAICTAYEPLRDYQVAAGRVLLGRPPEVPGF